MMDDGVALLIIGMGVVFLVLVVLATATWGLERVFAAPSEKVEDARKADGQKPKEYGTEDLERIALAAVALHLVRKEGGLSYASLIASGGQWKLAGRLNSLRK